DEIMEKIRKEVARRRSNLAEPAKPSPARDVPEAEPLEPVLLPRLNSHPQLEIKEDGYHINDFLQFHDRDFIINAYKGMLKRAPDNEGLSYYLNQLRQGIHSKIEILGRLHYSLEGKTKKVKVKGLLFPLGVAQAYKLPLLGHLMRFATATIRLPTILKNRVQFETHIMALHTQLQDHLHEMIGKLENALAMHAENIMSMESRKAEVGDVATQGETLKALHGKLTDICSMVEEQNPKVDDLPEELELSGQNYLSKAIKLADISTESIKKFPKTEVYSFLYSNIFYVSEVVARKQRRYIDYIDIEKAKGKTILDVGCGRGEFQKILRDKNISSIGIDTNGLEVELLKERGFDVYKADALDYLQTTDKIFYGITAFHVIEHFELDYLKIFFEHCYEKLYSNGLLILETINPHCQLGFSSFYMDETHVKPLPPEMIEFMLEWIGFKNIKTLYNFPLPKDYRMLETKRNYHDYAVIAYRS
ncbi:MAG: DUF4214 domain-containing protein, partial [Desulfobacteraceae bacterium]|nr:DUF4214 domain-containing protein [Desulfobacteraceae bacterium]